MREEIPDPAAKKLMSRCNNMAAVRLAIKKAEELDAFERQQRQQQPLASEEALVEQLPGQQPPTTEEAPAKPQPEQQPPVVVEALAEAQPEQQPPATEEAPAEAQPKQQPSAAEEAPAEQQPLGDEEAFDNEAEGEALSSDSDYCAVSDEDEAGRDILVEDNDTEMEVAAGLGSTTMSREDVVDLVEDGQDGEDGKEVPVSSGFKSQYIASIKPMREMLEARFAHSTWAGNHFQVEEPAPDEKVELILQTLKKLDPSLGTVSVTRKQLEKFQVLEKVLKNHAISTPYIVQFPSSLSAQTLKSYAGRLSQFAEFCHDSENISSLKATTSTVVRYVPWIGERGRIGAKSLHPYMSAINTCFELHNIDPIAKDSMHLTAARCGLMLRQRRLEAAPLRVHLSADVAYNFIERAELIVSAPFPDYQYDFRALVASVVNFLFFARGLTGVFCRVRDVHADDYNIALHVYREKGRAGRRCPDDLRVMLLPVSEHPG
eukprot:jgi/Tetstr1/460299/TSEL_005599.t1